MATTWNPGPSGTAGDDVANGDGANDFIDGLSGQDTLNGGGGNDTLIGGLDAIVNDGQVANGTFDNSTGWTLSGAGTQTRDGQLRFSQGGNAAGGTATTDVVVTEGQDYNLIFDYGQTGTGAGNFELGYEVIDADGSTVLSSGSFPGLVQGSSGTANITYTAATSGTATIRFTNLAATPAGARALYVDNLTNGTVSVDDDSIDGGDDDDTIVGGFGNDTIEGGSTDAGNDSLDGGRGDDSITDTGGGSETVDGGSGDDTIEVGGGDDPVNGKDIVDGGAGDDVISTGADNDTVEGGYGDDSILGGDGNDSLRGDVDGAVDGSEQIFFESGTSGAANWALTGAGTSNFRNMFVFGRNSDPLDGDATRTFAVPDGTPTLTIDPTMYLHGGGSGTYDYRFRVFDSDGNELDTATGTASGPGNGALITPTFDLDISDAVSGDVTVVMDVVSASATNANYFALGAFEATATTSLDDTIDGGDGDDVILGDAGDDSLIGGDDNDTIDGGIGNDTISGDGGDDSVVGREGADFITGNDGEDTLIGDDEIPTLGPTEDLVSNGDFSSGLDGWTLGSTAVRYFDGAGPTPPETVGLPGVWFTWNGSGANQNTYVQQQIQTGSDTLDVSLQLTYANGSGGPTNFGWEMEVFDVSDPSTALHTETGTVTGQTATTALPPINFTTGSLGGSGDYIVRFTTTSRSSNPDDLVLQNFSVVGLPVREFDDTIDGGSGNDLIEGGVGNDSLLGDVGNDTIDGGDGDDSMSGGDDRDTFNVDGGDTVDGGTGSTAAGDADDYDVLTYGGVELNAANEGQLWRLVDDAGNPEDRTVDADRNSFSGRLEILDGSGNSLSTREFVDFSEIESLFSRDFVITGDATNDLIDGSYIDEDDEYIDDDDGTDGNAGTLTGDDDSVVANGGDDTVISGVGNDTVDGGTGDDEIDAGVGDDSVQGGFGDDSILGGTGEDTLLGDGTSADAGLSSEILDPDSSEMLLRTWEVGNNGITRSGGVADYRAPDHGGQWEVTAEKSYARKLVMV